MRLSGLDWVSFRLANAYGPRNVSGPLPTFYPAPDDRQAVLRHGHAPRLHLRRTIWSTSCLKAVDGAGSAGVYHVSSGSDYSIKELFDATVEGAEHRARRTTSRCGRATPTTPSRSCSTRRKTKHDFGWSAHDAARGRRRGGGRVLPRATASRRPTRT